MRLTMLADQLRAAGLVVVETPGWKTRGRPGDFDPTGVIYHATADKARTGDGDRLDDAGAIAVIRDGRADLPGPIALAYVNRAGVWYMIAAGRCNTVKTGWSGPLKGLGNSRIVGVEAENDNDGEPWPAEQLRSLRLGFAVILRAIGRGADRLAGHFEHQPGDKTDPHGINMVSFRRDVAGVLAGEEDDMPTPQEVAKALLDYDGVPILGGDPKNPTTRVSWALYYGQVLTSRVDSKVVALTAKIEGLVTVTKTLADALAGAGGGTLDTAAVLAKLDDLVDQIGELQTRLNASEADREQLAEQLSAAYAAAGRDQVATPAG